MTIEPNPTLTIAQIAPQIIDNGKSGERGVLIGSVGSGKTQLALKCIEFWRYDAGAHILIIDTKPCFGAEYELNGLSAKRRYKNFREIHMMPNSYRVPLGTGFTAFNSIWKIAESTTPKNEAKVCIAQTDNPNNYHWLDYIIRMFYAQASKKYNSYLYVDEMVAFMRNSRKVATGVVQTVVSGRGKGVVFLGAAQRPVWFPKEILTEASKLFLFEIDSEDDLSHLKVMGAPKDITPPSQQYAFRYFQKRPRMLKTLRLAL